MPQPSSVIPILDCHVHFVHPEKMEEILGIMADVPCERFNLVCTPEHDGSTHNPAAVFFKQHYPQRVYISGALDYRQVLANPMQGAVNLANQVHNLKAQGFDGLKMIEGKPEVRKLLPYPLDGSLYAGVWEALEVTGMPVVFHVGDPDEFWDAQACPDWARANGWDYSDGSYPSKETLYREVENILARHPNLKLVLAHFYFLSADLERAARFLDAHPSVSFDLAPHIGMYYDFAHDPAGMRAFFIKYQERILYGTDIDTRVLSRSDALRVREWMGAIPRMIRSFLEEDEIFSKPGQPELHGIHLPEQTLHRIYHANFERIFGAKPAPLVVEQGKHI
jgi:hypothetical protein